MPFLSYQTDTARAVENAGRFLAEGGCAAVKLEGGTRSLPAIEAILAADIPVMGHVGLTPQSYRKLGGFKVQGREPAAARGIRDDAQALAAAGCFAIVLECVPAPLAAAPAAAVAAPPPGPPPTPTATPRPAGSLPLDIPLRSALSEKTYELGSVGKLRSAPKFRRCNGAAARLQRQSTR